MIAGSIISSFRRWSGRAVAVLLTLLLLSAPGLYATQFTVVNNCGYTVYPGVYPATYANGGFQLNPGASVSFSVPSQWNGRIWGRIGCDGSSPALCQTGQCGGTGLQCAGTTGRSGTSLAEFNLNANGTDYYDVSYVDGFDNPIGIVSSNPSCSSPNTCNSTPINNCSGDLKNGRECLSPCTVYNTDQYCCRGAYGTAQTCVVSQWPAAEQSFVNNIHNSCPGQYSYAYDDNVGLHTCGTGSNYTVTFCPSGSGGGGVPNLSGFHTLTPANAPGARLDDFLSGTGKGNQIDIWAANGTGAQSWSFGGAGVSPAGAYNIAVSYGPYCVTASGNTSGSVVNLQPCNGSAAQAWTPTPSGSGVAFHPANNSSLCLDVRSAGTASGTLVQAYTCNGTGAQQWQVN